MDILAAPVKQNAIINGKTGKQVAENIVHDTHCESSVAVENDMKMMAAGKISNINAAIGKENTTNLENELCSSKGSTSDLIMSTLKTDNSKRSPKQTFSISTKSFYSKPKKPSNHVTNASFYHSITSISNAICPDNEKANKKLRLTRRKSIHYKIRKRTIVKENARRSTSVDLNVIINNTSHEKLRKLIGAKIQENEQIEKIYNIFRNASDPISMARPLSVLSSNCIEYNNLLKDNRQRAEFNKHGFSDSESENEADFSMINVDEVPEVAPQQASREISESSNTVNDDIKTVNRKFFRNKRSNKTVKEISIIGNIKAIMSPNGQLTILPNKMKKRKLRKTIKHVGNKFSDEQATVNEILRSLYDSTSSKADLMFNDITDSNDIKIISTKNTITDEVTLACDSSDEATLNLLPVETTAMTTDSLTKFASSPSTIKSQLFPIFYHKNYKALPELPNNRKFQNRIWRSACGSNQSQIDAGQREFGATQCKQCGLLYVMHEPEEEKLHQDFHTSLQIIQFKGWIDEDIVVNCSDWGPDGRIIRLTENSTCKRREKIMEVVSLANRELGIYISSFKLPETFVAYLAVCKMQILGLCLVHPLSKANKYINVNGVECCTQVQYDAMCGVSRIWVAPLYRRLGIASKLIKTMRYHTIQGVIIPLDKVAFSAPTEMGKLFAKSVTQFDFLVYE